MGESPRPAQTTWKRSVAASSAPVQQLVVPEFAVAGSAKSGMLTDGQSETVSYRVFAGTWNVGGAAPRDDLDLDNWLDTAGSYDIYVLGFQEIVPLNARNVLGPKQRSAAMRWQLLIGDALNSRGRDDDEEEEDAAAHGHGAARMHQGRRRDVFRCVVSKQMVGIFVSVWMRSGLRRHVRHPGVSSVGAGVLGRLGNKGAVSVRFLLHGTSFCFVCCHLASGGDPGDALRRNADAADILSRTSFHNSGGASVAPLDSSKLPRKILHHDRVVLLGDLNYRVAMVDGEARELVRARKWGMLLENDELLLELSKGRQFDGWHEGRVTFAPTYKYHRNSDQFYWRADGVGIVEKQRHRAPAWCDRILWRGKGMSQVRYDRCGAYRLSDHRPVRAVFHALCERGEAVHG